MKFMITKYKRSVLLIFTIILCLSVFASAQIPSQDSVKVVQNPDINIAYGSQPSWMVTGAASSVRGSDLQSSFTTSFTNTLFGRIPGLSVYTIGNEPGNENTALFSRGINTFGVGGTGLLILVDGIQANLADLSAEEVESVTLLKDASATVMYGSRAANGVLLITTKRGVAGRLKVIFSTKQGFQSTNRLPQFLNSFDYATLYNEALANDGKPALYTNTDLNSYKNGDDPYFHPDVNWYKEVLRNATPISNYDLNFSGGNEVVKYFVLLNAIKSNSLLQNTGDQSAFSTNGSYQRLNFRSNIDINITKRLSANLTMGGTIVDKANPSGTTTDALFRTMSIIPPNSFPVYNENKTISRNSVYSNPLGNILNNGFYTSNGRTLLTTMGFTEQLDMITPGLSITARTSFNSYFLSQSNKSRTYQSFIASRDPVSGVVSYTPNGINSSLTASEGASDQNRSFTFQSFLNYDRTFGTHTISSVFMYNADDYTISGNNFPSKHVNLSGRATYAKSQKYIGEFSFAYMGSENFSKKGRFGFFPAMSLGWIVSNEGFLKDNSTINFLKIRGSYGLIGNDKIGSTAFMFEQYYPYGNNYYFGTGNTSYSSIIQGSPANTNVTWEKEKSANVGLEASLMNHLDVTIDVFNRDRYDILVQPNRTDPDFMGYTKPYLNQGKANNKGFEAVLRYHNDNTKDLKFFVEASVSYFKNKVVYNSEALQLNDYLYQTGQQIGQPYGLVALGFFKDQTEIDASPKQIWTVVQPGDVKYKDQNNDDVINQNDIYPVGNTTLPNITAGLHVGLKYKGFDFDMFFQGVTDRTITFDGYYFQAFQNNGKAGTIALNRWTPGTAATATYPRLASNNNDNNYRYSTLWQHDGSFVKLRSIELGYTLPSRISNAIKMENMRVFINGTNLFSIDHMNGYVDPENFSGYPVLKTVSIGLRVQFQ